MSLFDATKATIGNATDFVLVQLPDADRRIALVRIEGTFVGTIQIQDSSDLKTFTVVGTTVKADTGATGNPAAQGVFAALLGASSKGFKVLFSSYTSGSAKIEVATVRQSP